MDFKKKLLGAALAALLLVPLAGCGGGGGASSGGSGKSSVQASRGTPDKEPVDAAWQEALIQKYGSADYKALSPHMLEVFKQVLDEAHRRNLRVFMDLVVNHTSDEHPWFLASRRSKTSPYHDYYIWRPGRNKGSTSGSL